MTKTAYPKVEEIITFEAGGNWPTKSGGQLSVLFKLDYDIVHRFLSYDDAELSKLPVDIRGLRSYRVENIPKGAIGANEWHAVRNELVFVLKGSIRWDCTDLYGGERSFVIDGSQAVFTPHHIMHRYTALEDNTTVGVLANTLFIPEQSSTHDSYPSESFNIDSIGTR